MVYKFDKETLTFYKIRKFWLYLPYALLAISIGINIFSLQFSFRVLKEKNLVIDNIIGIIKPEIEWLNEIIYESKKEPLTEKTLWNFMGKRNIKFPYVVMAQGILESGLRTTNNNNLFGMYYPRTRTTTSLGPNSEGWAKYVDWKQSVIDMALWQYDNLKGKNIRTEEDYLIFLESRGYAEDPQYKNKLSNLIAKLKTRYPGT